MLQDGPLTPEKYLISPCPVTTALAIIALSIRWNTYKNQITTGTGYLNETKNPDGGWGRTPASMSDEKSTEICNFALTCQNQGVTPDAIYKIGANISSTWLRDVPKLILGWPPDSPITNIIEFFITTEPAGNLINDFSFDYLPVALRLLPPSARPFILALSCIRQHGIKRRSRKLLKLIKKMVDYQSPHGAWSEDILITCLCILCLFLTDQFPSALIRGIKWLASVQYHSGAWPAFNQLTNWDTGLAAFAANECFAEKSDFVIECARYLNIRANQDGSYGTLSPYSFPDLDDTAMALLGLSAAVLYDTHYGGRIAQTGQLMLSLQNHDGSWGTFPEVLENPPYCTCYRPVHIKSVDVTIHVLQSLLKSGIDIKHPQIQKALWWLAYQQRWDGSWKSTWYIGNCYATSQALELLTEYDLWPKARQKARNWLISAQNEKGSWPIGSAGECGLVIASLLKNGESPNSASIIKGLDYLTSLQQPDGSFKPSYGGLYAGGLYYEDPITEAIAALRAIKIYLDACS